MVRAPAAPSESLTSESSLEEPPEPVDLEPEADVVMEPDAVGPAGMVPLFWGNGAGTAAVAVAMASVAAEDAAATAVEAAVSTGATASLTDDVTSDAMLETAGTEADSTTDERALVTDDRAVVAASGTS
jgi:hypothetical protein